MKKSKGPVFKFARVNRVVHCFLPVKSSHWSITALCGKADRWNTVLLYDAPPAKTKRCPECEALWKKLTLTKVYEESVDSANKAYKKLLDKEAKKVEKPHCAAYPAMGLKITEKPTKSNKNEVSQTDLDK